MFSTDVGSASYVEVCYKTTHTPSKRMHIFSRKETEKVKEFDETGGIFHLREFFFCQDVPRISMTTAVKTGYLLGKQSCCEILFVPKLDTFKVFVKRETLG
jgi:hypothetical protein